MATRSEPLQQPTPGGTPSKHTLKDSLIETYETDDNLSNEQATIYWLITLVPFLILGFLSLLVLFVLSV